MTRNAHDSPKNRDTHLDDDLLQSCQKRKSKNVSNNLGGNVLSHEGGSTAQEGIELRKAGLISAFR